LERRLAITYAVSVTATLCTACVAVATVSGGLFVSAAPAMKVGVKQVENIDDYIVVHSATTAPSPVTSAATVAQAYIVAPQTTASTEAPEITEAPAPLVVQAMPAVVAPPEAKTEDPVSDDVEAPGPQEPEDTRQPSSDGSGSGTHHHSDDGHEGDDHQHEGGGD
jgi:hypothetical protein